MCVHVQTQHCINSKTQSAKSNKKHMFAKEQTQKSRDWLRESIKDGESTRDDHLVISGNFLFHVKPRTLFLDLSSSH